MIALLLALALPAHAAPDGFTEVKSNDGCTLFKGVEEAGVTPMRAECHWADVKPEVLSEKVADYEGYDELIFAITESRVIGERDGAKLVHQVQETRGIATREVVLAMTTDTTEDRTRVSWTTAEAKIELVDGHVLSPRNDGAWEIAAHPEGGAKVVHEIAYDPGGNVPGWVVKWFQVGGMLQVMEEVHAAAAKASTAD